MYNSYKTKYDNFPERNTDDLISKILRQSARSLVYQTAGMYSCSSYDARGHKACKSFSAVVAS